MTWDIRTKSIFGIFWQWMYFVLSDLCLFVCVSMEQLAAVLCFGWLCFVLAFFFLVSQCNVRMRACSIRCMNPASLTPSACSTLHEAVNAPTDTRSFLSVGAFWRTKVCVCDDCDRREIDGWMDGWFISTATEKDSLSSLFYLLCVRLFISAEKEGVLESSWVISTVILWIILHQLHYIWHNVIPEHCFVAVHFG